MNVMNLTTVSEAKSEAAGAARSHLTITLELVIYLALLLLALTLRVAELDTIPMTDAEARQALAAWRAVWPSAPGPEIVPYSPALFMAQSLLFSTLGGSEFAARILTALAGAALVVSPAAFRGLLGRTRALLLALALLCSPALLVSSRTGSPMVWVLAAAVVGLWALWRYWDDRRPAQAILATVCLAAMALLAGPGGPIMAFILLGAGVFALWLTRTDAEGRDILLTVGERFGGWPWRQAASIAVLAAALVSTGFLLYPAGLSAVGELLAQAGRGLTTPTPGAPVFFPIWIVLFYEPFIAITAIVGAWWLARRGAVTFVERFLLGWVVFALFASVIYAGAGADHALWLSLPLAGLAASAAAHLLHDERGIFWRSPGWVKWLLALIMLALMFSLAVHGQTLARTLLLSADGSLQLNQIDARSAVWFIVTLLFMVTGFFMAASVWGAYTAVQGWVFGALIFGLITSLGAGWNAAAVEAGNPVELWHVQPTSAETWLLRQTLTEVSTRESGGFPQLELAVLAPADGVVAWLLRDYPRTRFITDVSEARGLPVVLLPSLPEPPDLGGSYVGHPFTITSVWSERNLRAIDFPAWWMARRIRLPGASLVTMVLWLRQDVYDGADFSALR